MSVLKALSLLFRQSVTTLESVPVGCLPLLFVPGFLFLMAGLSLTKPWQMPHWQKAPGTITFFDGDGPSQDKGGEQYTILVQYRYVVDGATYSGDTFNLDQSETVDAQTLQNFIRRYPAGKAVTTYYDPDDVTRSVLTLSYGTAGSVMIFGGVLCAVALILVIAYWRKLRLGEQN